MPNLAAAATASRRSQAVAERTTTPHGRIELDTVGLHFKSKALEQRFRSFFFWTSAPTTSIIFLALALCEVTTLVLDVVINDSRGVDGMDDVCVGWSIAVQRRGAPRVARVRPSAHHPLPLRVWLSPLSRSRSPLSLARSSNQSADFSAHVSGRRIPCPRLRPLRRAPRTMWRRMGGLRRRPWFGYASWARVSDPLQRVLPASLKTRVDVRRRDRVAERRRRNVRSLPRAVRAGHHDAEAYVARGRYAHAGVPSATEHRRLRQVAHRRRWHCAKFDRGGVGRRCDSARRADECDGVQGGVHRLAGRRGSSGERAGCGARYVRRHRDRMRRERRRRSACTVRPRGSRARRRGLGDRDPLQRLVEYLRLQRGDGLRRGGVADREACDGMAHLLHFEPTQRAAAADAVRPNAPAQADEFGLRSPSEPFLPRPLGPVDEEKAGEVGEASRESEHAAARSAAHRAARRRAQRRRRPLGRVGR